MKSRPALVSVLKSISALAACAFAVALVAPAVTHANDAAAAASKVLPLSASFAKGADAEKGPFTLTLKNDSSASLTVSAQVLLSVHLHATNKARAVPAQTIAAGKTLEIADLAAGDKVHVSADGYATLELVVPAK